MSLASQLRWIAAGIHSRGTEVDADVLLEAADMIENLRRELTDNAANLQRAWARDRDYQPGPPYGERDEAHEPYGFDVGGRTPLQMSYDIITYAEVLENRLELLTERLDGMDR